jgi:hypothetical protein
MLVKIADRTIDHCKAIDLCSKFQLSSGLAIGDRQTDGRTDDTSISVEPIFLKKVSICSDDWFFYLPLMEYGFQRFKINICRFKIIDFENVEK